MMEANDTRLYWKFCLLSATYDIDDIDIHDSAESLTVYHTAQ